MRIILERAEIIQILNEKFETTFDPNSVIIRTDPFEVELRDVPFPAPESKKSEEKPQGVVQADAVPPVAPVDETERFHARAFNPNASLEAPPVDADEMPGGSDGGLSLHNIAAFSQDLANDLARRHPDVYGKKRSGGSANTPADSSGEY